LSWYIVYRIVCPLQKYRDICFFFLSVPNRPFKIAVHVDKYTEIKHNFILTLVYSLLDIKQHLYLYSYTVDLHFIVVKWILWTFWECLSFLFNWRFLWSTNFINFNDYRCLFKFFYLKKNRLNKMIYYSQMQVNWNRHNLNPCFSLPFRNHNRLFY